MQVNDSVLAVAEIERLDSLRTLVDSQRHRIVTLLMDEALTATELAERLEIGRTRLYHHLRLLEQHGIIRVVERRIVSGIEERRYRSIARTFRVNRSLLGSQASEPEISDAQASFLEAMAADLRARAISGPASRVDDDSDVLVARTFLHLNDARRRELRTRLSALIHEYRNPDADGRETELGVALYTTERDAT